MPRVAKSRSVPLVVGLDYSPWTERVLWVLDDLGIDYAYQQYTILLGELGLRAKMGKWSGKISVPVMIHEGASIEGSRAIVDWAIGQVENKLMPDRQDVLRWDELSEAACAEGRSMLVDKMIETPESLVESQKGVVPAPLQRPLVPLARWIAGRTRSKYQGERRGGARIAALDALTEHLGGTHERTIYDAFSYADITMAVILQTVRPVGPPYIHLAPATETCWTTESLIDRFGDAIAWRDYIYMKYRSAAAHGC